MTIYCGVDFHARQHSISYCDASDGELHYQELDHEGDDVRAFYSRFTGEVVVGLEASGRERLVRAITGGARPSSPAWPGGGSRPPGQATAEERPTRGRTHPRPVTTR
jgi:hypothetical protein